MILSGGVDKGNCLKCYTITIEIRLEDLATISVLLDTSALLSEDTKAI
jgi:hypothetical protein